MANPQEGSTILRILSYTASLVIDGLSLANPQNVRSVFSEMKPLPAGFLRLSLFIIPIPLFIGYFLFSYYFRSTAFSTTFTLIDSLKLALMYYIAAALLPMIMAYVLYLFDVRLVKAKVTHNEALTLFTYALTPGILSGIFKVSPLIWVLHIIGMMYSIYLIHSGLETRYGQERSVMQAFVFLVLIGMFSALIILVLLKAVLGIPLWQW